MTQTGVLPVYSYIGKCIPCEHAVGALWTREQASDASHYVRCGICNRRRTVLPVDGVVGKRECGEWCTTGTGRSCKCTCGGANHGLAWRVK